MYVIVRHQPMIKLICKIFIGKHYKAVLGIQILVVVRVLPVWEGNSHTLYYCCNLRCVLQMEAAKNWFLHVMIGLMIYKYLWESRATAVIGVGSESTQAIIILCLLYNTSVSCGHYRATGHLRKYSKKRWYTEYQNIKTVSDLSFTLTQTCFSAVVIDWFFFMLFSFLH